MADLRMLSLGAGVQSSAVLLMMEAGEIEPADVAIFADTQWEPAAVYDWLAELERLSSIEIVRVTAGDIRADALDDDHDFASIPFYVENLDGSTGMGRRQCTNEYKIQPIERELRRRLDVPTLRGRVVEQVFGISLDEVRRMRSPRRAWQRFEYPLVDLRMSRLDCLRWIEAAGLPTPPRSACVGCPYRTNDEWKALAPDELADAIAFDTEIRERGRRSPRGWSIYLHQTRTPLADVDLSSEEDRGQLVLWDNECEGLCGV